jgi:superfamily II DNA helicase RecQ
MIVLSIRWRLTRSSSIKDGQTAEVTLFYNKRDLSFTFMEETIKSYCLNSNQCRREVLFKDFGTALNKPTGCLCCDICSNNQC